MDSTGNKTRLAVVGKSVPRVDARERVTGRAMYPADIQRAGMAHARLKRSPHAHARIVSIDTSRALRLRGVLAIVTAADFPVVPPRHDDPIRRDGRGCLADLRAEHGAQQSALGRPAGGGRRGGGLARGRRSARPDRRHLRGAGARRHDRSGAAARRADPARASADERASSRRHGRRPMSARAQPSNAATRRRLWPARPRSAGRKSSSIPATKATSSRRRWSPRSIRTALRPCGPRRKGTMPPRSCCMPSRAFRRRASRSWRWKSAAASAARSSCMARRRRCCCRKNADGPSSSSSRATRSCKAAADRRPARASRSRPAPTQDGKLVALEGTYTMDAGGFPGVPTSLLMQASAAHYQCPNLKLIGIDVVTNKPKTEAYRGPGGIQAAFAMEQAIDDLAVRLNMDPLELRKRNASRTGDPMPIGTPFPSIGLDDDPRCGRPARLLDHAAGQGPSAARPWPGARLLARHVDDVGLSHHDCQRRAADGDARHGRYFGHAHDDGAGRRRGVRS